MSHSPPAIRHTRPRVRRPGIGSAWHALDATRCYVFGPFYPHFAIQSAFQSGRGQPLSATQGKRVATFALVTTVGPQPRPARSTPGEPGRAADRQACAAWFKRRSQLRGAWGRCPKGDAPRSEAGALGASWLSPARPQPPLSCDLHLNHAAKARRSAARPGSPGVDLAGRGSGPTVVTRANLAIQGAANTSVSARGILSVWTPRFPEMSR